jgi:hypothetical protein
VFCKFFHVCLEEYVLLSLFLVRFSEIVNKDSLSLESGWQPREDLRRLASSLSNRDVFSALGLCNCSGEGSKTALRR